MKLLNFSQRKPVAFNGNVILFRKNQIRFPLSVLENQIDEQYGNQLMPTGLSIRDIVSLDFVFSRTQIKQYENLVTFEKSLPHERSCKAVYDKDGHFLYVRLKFKCPQYLFDSKTQISSWVDYQWTLDAEGNRLLRIDHLKRHERIHSLCLVSREFISVIGQSVLRRKLIYYGLVLKKVETDLYTNGGTWLSVNEKSFPILHWKKISELDAQCSDKKQKDVSLRQFFVSLLLKLKFNH